MKNPPPELRLQGIRVEFVSRHLPVEAQFGAQSKSESRVAYQELVGEQSVAAVDETVPD